MRGVLFGLTYSLICLTVLSMVLKGDSVVTAGLGIAAAISLLALREDSK